MPKVSEIIQKKAEILSNKHMIRNYYKLSLYLPEIVRSAQPGQFVMLRISDGYQPVLRRPFSIHSIGGRRLGYKNRVEILYEVVGGGTKILSKKKSGEYLDVLGPLGNGFNLSSISYPPSAILVAGGIGVAPLFFLAQCIIERARHSALSNPFILIGAKTKKEILCKKEFENLGLDVKISTDDGSAGFKGKAPGLLRHLLANIEHRVSSIYACGPKLMLKEISIVSKKSNIPAQICLDEYMACGLGICLGCMVKTKKGYLAVCRDGPVFDSDIIKW